VLPLLLLAARLVLELDEAVEPTLAVLRTVPPLLEPEVCAELPDVLPSPTP
jgi:hypothetical protein